MGTRCMYHLLSVSLLTILRTLTPCKSPFPDEGMDPVRFPYYYPQMATTNPSSIPTCHFRFLDNAEGDDAHLIVYSHRLRSPILVESERESDSMAEDNL